MENTISPKEMLDHLKEMSDFADHFQRMLKNTMEIEKKEDQQVSNQWRCAIEDHPDDDDNILVAWKDGDDNWCGPIRAYYCEDDEEYYALDVLPPIPVNCIIWHPLPKFPGE